jgi:hypothetical protein
MMNYEPATEAQFSLSRAGRTGFSINKDILRFLVREEGTEGGDITPHFWPPLPPLPPNKLEDDPQRGCKMDYQLIAAVENIELGWSTWDFQAADLLFRVISQMIDVFEKLIIALSRVVERKI